MDDLQRERSTHRSGNIQRSSGHRTFAAGHDRQGVGLWFWRHSRQLRTPETREEFFAKLQRLGVVGAKVDFFDHEHKEVIDLFTALLAAAARHQIMVNFLGAN